MAPPKIQILKTSTPNKAPTALLPGELAIEMASDPPRLWVGVPASIDAAGMKMLLPSASGSSVTVADTPPAAPKSGDLWYESDSGHLFVWFVDADSGQWVSTTIQGPSGLNGVDGSDGIMAEPPQDGNEYTRVNGVWRLKSQTLNLGGTTGAVGATAQVPAGAKIIKYTGNLGLGGPASPMAISIRVSADGTNMIITSDYRFGGVYMPSTGGATAMPNTSATQLVCGSAVNVANHQARIDGHLQVSRVGTNLFSGHVRGTSHNAAAIYNNMYQHFILEQATPALELKAVNFAAHVYPTITFAPDSYIDIEWVY